MSASSEAIPSTRRSDGFADFYRCEVGGQVRRAALLLGSSDLANDVVHDALVEIYQRWDHILQPGPYLNRAVLNRCRDAARRRSRQGGLLGRLVTPATEPDHESLADLLDVLPFNQRAAIVLRYYVGLGNLEIAHAMGCPPGSVGPWIDRALSRLRKELA